MLTFNYYHAHSVQETDVELVFFTFQFSQISHEGGVFHTNCVNYSKTANALEKLRKNEDFCEFEKVKQLSKYYLHINHYKKRQNSYH